MIVKSTCRDRMIVATLAVLLLAIGACAKKPRNIEKTADGIVVTPQQGPAKRVRLQVMSDRIIRVTAVPTESLQLPESLAVVAKPAPGVSFTLNSADGNVTV